MGEITVPPQRGHSIPSGQRNSSRNLRHLSSEWKRSTNSTKFISCSFSTGRLLMSRLENPNLAEWAGHQERLSYYRGHRDGRRIREMLADRIAGVPESPRQVRLGAAQD